MHRANVHILAARGVQIICSLISLGICAALGIDAAQATEWRWGGQGYGYYTSAAWLSAATALCGVFGLFGVKPEISDDREIRLYLLLCFIDIWAFAATVSAGSCLAALFTVGAGELHGEVEVQTILAAILAFLCTLPIAFLFMRTIRTYTISVNYWVKDKEFDSSFDAATIEHRLQALESNYGGPKTIAASQHPDESHEVKSVVSSRPQSTAETTANWTTVTGATTLTIFPNIDGVTQVRIGPPTEAPSELAPSYSSRLGQA